MLKLADNPPIKPSWSASLTALEGDWWVAHTRARSEKALAWDLIAGRISYFLPMAERTTFSGGRKRRGLIPVFPSYVFFAGDEVIRHRVMATSRVCQTILVRQRSQFVAELEAIDRALSTRLTLDLYPFATVGKRCRVRYGPLMGTEGIIVQKHDVTRLVLQVSMLGQGVGLEISPDLLEPIE